MFTDKKRCWWTLSIFYPLIPVLTIGLNLRYENSWLLLLPSLVGYVILPMLATPIHFIALGAAIWVGGAST